jgi:hypothetical protein
MELVMITLCIITAYLGYSIDVMENDVMELKHQLEELKKINY